MDEATEFGLVQGLTFPFSTVERQAVGFSLAGRQLEVDPVELLSLQFAAAFAFGCATVLSAGRGKPEVIRLSRRQRDVIRWASDGLTADRIADRLKISSHTVDTHLRIVRMKLGASSTIQAVAEAIRRGIIN